ncbi:MarR family winged helix-turn-helix transcriptional regulator [Saccharopolyspora taberi]|uniref:MarR family winged helix-turn-helix transcriptional regulator n=1 Tax=Saccharopolyspora taberi TaxID=60895 RepID=UPI0031E1DFC6
MNDRDAQEIAELLGLVPLLAAYFRRAHSEMPAEMREAFTTHGLTARHGAVLTQLIAGDELSVTELSHRLGVSLPTASELVGDLARADWVQRREDPANRRRTLVSLPPERRAALEGFVATRAQPILRAMEGLSPEQREGFLTGLRAWAHEVRNW